MTLPTLSLTSWAGITAACALLAGAWRYVLSALKWISTLFICRVVVKDDAARAVMSHVWSRGRKSPFGLRLFGGVQSFVSPKKRVEVVGFESMTSEPLLFWFGRVPVLVGNGFDNGRNSDAPNIGNTHTNAMPVTIRYFRGTLDIDAMLTEAISAYNTLRQARDKAKRGVKRFNVFRMHGTGGYQAERGSGTDSPKAGNSIYPSGGDSNDIVQSIHHGELRLLTWKAEELVERNDDTAPFTNHPVAPEILAEFDEIETFLAKEQWFRSKGIPWRRGYLIHGPGGGGKTTLIRNVAIKYDLPVYSLDLSSYDNRSFVTDWKTAQQNAPAIVLLEDFDCTFSQRKNLVVEGKNRDGVTFDCLLNTISGIASSEGIILAITTNRLETLDPALGCSVGRTTKSTRPGRIDKVVYIGPMREPERRKLAEIILADWPGQIERAIIEGEGEMAAQFQDRCSRIATELFWKAVI